MSARVLLLEDTAGVEQALAELLRGIAVGDVHAIALVVVDHSGGLAPWWGAARTLGTHAGSILRGAVTYLGACMDAEALARE